MPDLSPSDIISHYDLKPHPEGGFFKESFRDSGLIPESSLPQIFCGDRNYSTAIYFLLPQGSKSNLHRIASDEVWHFYLGGPLTIVQISPEGILEKTILGPDILRGQKVQHVVPAGYWFGSCPNPESEYSFVGCTVAPGFDFADFEMVKRGDLLQLFPHATAEILHLTES